MANRLALKLLLLFAFVIVSIAPPGAATPSAWSFANASAFAAVQDDEDKSSDDEDDEDKPLIDDEQANSLLREFGKLFRRRNNRDNDEPSRAFGATLQYRIYDWAGRPTDGVVQVANENNRYTSRSVAGRNTIQGIRHGVYTLTVDPVRDLPPEPFQMTIDRDATYVASFLLRPPDGDDAVFDEVDPPKVKLPTGPAIPGDRDLGAPPKRVDLPDRNLGEGERVVINGQATDPQGRPVDVLVIVSHHGRDIGYVRSVASRFSIFDLEPGEEYVFRARHVRRRDGPWAEATMTLGHAVARLVFRVER